MVYGNTEHLFEFQKESGKTKGLGDYKGSAISGVFWRLRCSVANYYKGHTQFFLSFFLHLSKMYLHIVQQTYKSLQFCPILMFRLIKHTVYGCTQGKRGAIFVCAICSCERQITSGRLMSGEPSGELTAEIWYALKLLCLHTSTWMSMFNEIF